MSSCTITRWLFLRLLGLVYLVAFASLAFQITGLVGQRGILPAAEFLAAVQAQTGPECYYLLPTLFWLGVSDTWLQVACGTGVVLALLLVADVAPGPVLVLLWAGYLSLVGIGQDFLAFQWDNLLLETGFLAIFLAPWRLRPAYLGRPGVSPPENPASTGSRLAWLLSPPLIFLWLLRWLLFRLMLCSGLVKLLSHDPTWRDLTALTYHYETQPLPPWTAWYAYHLPALFHQASTAAMFVIELALPFFIFGPRRLRLAAAGGLMGLQALIILTGNYAFCELPKPKDLSFLLPRGAPGFRLVTSPLCQALPS